jgi:DNA adenine methylase
MSKTLFPNDVEREPAVKCLSPWFGSNRMLAPMVGQELRGCKWVGVPFAGGMSELLHIKARTINVNDLHRHVIMLASVLANPKLAPTVYRRLRRVPFHAESLDQAQAHCRHMETVALPLSDEQRIEWAAAYFVAAWMPRHGSGGTKGELSVGMSIRWNAGGGDSAKHYWGAVESIRAWHKILRRGNFTSLDWGQFIANCQDEPGHGIYCDPPFPGPGEKYLYRMDDEAHRNLAKELGRYEQARVVARFYDHPLVRELYPEGRWTWRRLAGRDQTNDDAKPEVLIVNGKLRGAA